MLRVDEMAPVLRFLYRRDIVRLERRGIRLCVVPCHAHAARPA
jgi:hypothetical protein